MTIKTRHTHPDHPVVGRFFRSNLQTYYCDSYDSAIGFWMTNIRDIRDRRNVSESAPGRTYHEVYDYEERKRARLGITDATADEVERELVAARAWKSLDEDR